MSYDVEQFGPIVESLVNEPCERTLAANSLKIRFDTHIDHRGLRYIWIDPPWEFWHEDSLVTRSADYTESQFSGWSELFHPLDHTIFEGWSHHDDGVSFKFSDGYSLFLPSYSIRVVDSVYWYVHWYARGKTDSEREGP